MSLPCPRPGCPGLEMHDGKPDGCGHGTIDHGCMAVAAERDGLRLACQAFAVAVRGLYSPGGSPSEIVATWAPHGVTPEQVAAVRELEGSL